jgi:hypothetical protein
VPGDFYSLVVLGDLRAVMIDGDIAAVERLTAALAPSPAVQLVA